MRDDARTILPAVLLLTLAVLAAFLPSLGYGFAPIDDESNILDNPSFRGFGKAQLRWMFTTRHGGHFIPLTWMTLALDYTLEGLRPRAYHRTSLLFHLGTALLFLLLVARLLRDEGRAGPAVAGALAAALAFAVHPLRVESVVWISERRDVVCGFFSMLALHAYVSAARAEDAGRRRRFLLAASALFAAALLSKGIALGLLAAFVALDVTLLRRLPPHPSRWWRPEHRPVLMEKAGLLAVAALSAVATLFAIGYVLSPLRTVGFGPRLAAMVYGLTFYVQKTVVPWPLPLLVYRTGMLRLSDPEVLVRALLLAGAVLAVVAVRRRAPGLAAASATYAAFALPVSGILQAGPQLVAHRYSYLSCLSWAVLLGWAVCRWLQRGGRRREAAAAACGVALGAGLVVLTRAQAALWRDPVVFSTAAAAASPAAWQPRYTLAGAHLRAGRWGEAVQQLRVGLARNPGAPPLLNMAALLLATCPDDRFRSAAEARVLADRLQRIVGGDDPWALLTLSAARAEGGDFAGASAAAAQGLAAAGGPDAPAAVRLRAALVGYAAARPLRMAPADWGEDRLAP